MTVKEIRKAAGMTQATFAEYIGVGLRTVQGWEATARGCPEYIRKLIEYKFLKEGIMKTTMPPENIV